jgi:hypothetical protein
MTNDLRNPREKNNRVYSEDELALFARYVARRTACRPHACTYGPLCWVQLGPPGLDSRNGGTCSGCNGLPTTGPDGPADPHPVWRNR